MLFYFLCFVAIYMIFSNQIIKSNNFKEKQQRELCKYLSSNFIFNDKNSLKEFMIDQYYEMVIFNGIRMLNAETIDAIYTNITNSNDKITELYNTSCRNKN